MTHDRWLLKETVDGQWMLLLVASNGETRVWSESYTRREDAIRAYRSLRWAAAKAFLRGLLVGPTQRPVE